MNSINNFYDTLDLKYPELAIAMQDIDRTNPGKVKFIIPILTPNMDNSKLIDNKIFQNSSALQNKDKSLVEVDDLELSNYIEIPVPKELCAFVGGEFDIIAESIVDITNADTTINGSQSGSGFVAEGGSFSVNGTVKGNMAFKDGYVLGRVNTMPVDRYIKEKSKWIVVFVGGDITKPRVISRYLDD